MLVAFTVEAPNDDHHRVLMANLPRPGAEVTSWWVAEDERSDGSDCDSAVFVTPGWQAAATRLLRAFGMLPPTWAGPQLEGARERLGLAVAALTALADEEYERDDEDRDDDLVTDANALAAELGFALDRAPEGTWIWTATVKGATNG